jgi:hypothetical protein
MRAIYLAALWLIEIFLALVLCVGNYHDQRLPKYWLQYWESGDATAKNEWEHQELRSARKRIVVNGVILLVLVVNTFALVKACRPRRPLSQQNDP